MFDDIDPILRGNAQLLRKGRFLTLDFGIGVDDQLFMVSITPERVTVGPASDHASKAAFVVRAPRAVWDEFAKPLPLPGFQDPTAMVESGRATITGDLLPFFSNQLFVKGVIRAVFKGSAAW
ncbi:MAG: hypothetical protein ACRYG5_03320 [Janthinobacterium lividum]